MQIIKNYPDHADLTIDNIYALNLEDPDDLAYLRGYVNCKDGLFVKRGIEIFKERGIPEDKLNDTLKLSNTFLYGTKCLIVHKVKENRVKLVAWTAIALFAIIGTHKRYGTLSPRGIWKQIFPKKPQPSATKTP